MSGTEFVNPNNFQASYILCHKILVEVKTDSIIYGI